MTPESDQGKRWGTVDDPRCCGDHPGEWDTEAVAGTGWCRACLERLRCSAGQAAGHAPAERPPP